jgi:hypothetical protein
MQFYEISGYADIIMLYEKNAGRMATSNNTITLKPRQLLNFDSSWFLFYH